MKKRFYILVFSVLFYGNFSALAQPGNKQQQLEQQRESILDVKPKTVSVAPASVGNSQTSKYRITPRKQNLNYMLSMLLNPDNFMVHQAQISQPDAKKNLLVQYGPYQKIEEDYYPTQLGILAQDGLEQTRIFIRYKKIDLNVSVGFPFNIPKGYIQRSFK